VTTVRRDAIREGITLLTLDRPERLNAMSRELVHDLHEALDAVEDDRRPGNDRCRMAIHLRHPPALSCLPIDCDHVGAVMDPIGAENVSDDDLIAIQGRADTRDGAGDAIVLGDLVRPDETASLLFDRE